MATSKVTSGMRLGLGDLVGAGGRAVSKYTGMLLAVFIVQSLVAGACILAVWALLANAFAHLPMFDLAVDGDLAALIASFRYAEPSFLAQSREGALARIRSRFTATIVADSYAELYREAMSSRTRHLTSHHIRIRPPRRLA